jgi:hypothetical protein
MFELCLFLFHLHFLLLQHTAADVQLITAPDVVLLNAILVDAGVQIVGALFVTVN